MIPDEGTALQSRAPVTNGANGMGAMDDPFSDPFSQVVCFKLLIAASRSVFGIVDDSLSLKILGEYITEL